MGQTPSTRRIGEVLVEEGLVSEATLRRALGFQRTSGERMRLGTILLTWDLVEEGALLGALARLHRCAAAPWDVLAAASTETVLLLSRSQAARLGALAYASQRGLVRVAFANPSDILAVDEAAALIGRRVAPAVSPEVRLLQAHRKFYGQAVPLGYRRILQRLDRRTTEMANAIPGAEDAASADSAAASAGPGARSIPIAADSGSAALFGTPKMPPRAQRAPSEIALPESREDAAAFQRLVPPADASAPRHPSKGSPSPVPFASRTRGASSRFLARKDSSAALTDDSLSQWVGEALSAFTGESTEPAVIPFEVESDPDSPAGVEDPANFGRRGARTLDPRDDVSDPSALTRQDSSTASAHPAEAFDGFSDGEWSPLTEEDRRGVPDSIPPFRRAGDPLTPSTPPTAAPPAAISAFEREEAAIAGMWRPAPESAPRPDPIWNPSGQAAPGDAKSRDEIADSVLRDSLTSLPRVMLLGAGRTGIVGWRGRGRGLTPASVAAIRVPHAEISVFSAVQESGVPHFAVTDRAEWPRALAELFGAKPLDCAIFPIRVLDTVAAFLYADRLGEPMQYEDFALIARAAASAAGVLSRFLIHPNAPGFPVGP